MNGVLLDWFIYLYNGQSLLLIIFRRSTLSFLNKFDVYWTCVHRFDVHFVIIAVYHISLINKPKCNLFRIYTYSFFNFKYLHLSEINRLVVVMKYTNIN
jgi:DMSO/TMAO reductase YedYZ heme-binding membrane subunit